ncbi:MAG: helix-turn-helix transcriptional regulator [Dethiobacter sp.]|nr:helix-turn-helix transcriptional regulator [Dethiobacter sp.]MBS3989449.1 helix-turn-helix transcriptional regulator [Dethiobacter sp.]
MNKEMMKGSIDILLLSLLATKEMYGYEVVQNLKKRSSNLYEMSEGTLYPALKRLEQQNLLISFWGDTKGGGRRKYYQITDAGNTELKKKLVEWSKVHKLIVNCTEGLIWMS